MRHLTADEIGAAVAGDLAVDQVSHALTCDGCRRLVDDARRLGVELATLKAVPEPSPWFWDALSARVKAATAEQPIPAAAWWSWRSAGVGMLACAAVVLMMIRGAVLPSRHIANDPSPTGAASTAAIGEESRWDEVVAQAATLSADDASGLAPAFDASGALEDLTPLEREVFVRLLTMEMHGNGVASQEN